MGQVRPDWETIYSIMKDYKKHSVEESKIMLFGDPDFDDFNEILYTRCNNIDCTHRDAPIARGRG
jgi:hypothetical protein